MTKKMFESKNGNLTVNRFYGGKEKGVCVQLTVKNPEATTIKDMFSYIQMTASEFEEMIKASTKFPSRIKKVEEY